ncbi:MAG: ABC transporter permease [Deltaproteobacteria bacterium]|jgi:cell division transport system permease protein|nr:ABC transporter permease [Deltaproteobacteria bacterium]MBW2486427.1 ABC transporter permease [Deltaproteobacteria bacterium]
MLILFFKRALEDFRNNRLLNLITLLTISLSILIVSTFILFFINTRDMMNFWKKGLRIMVYVKPEVVPSEMPEVGRQIKSLEGVKDIRFISKEAALRQLKSQMKRQASLFENLDKNPLPDAFETELDVKFQRWEKLEALATQIEALDAVQEVEYGQQWLGRFSQVFNLFTLAGYTMCGIFFMAAVFIVANTIRLVIYSRRDEIEIMRLVGAAEHFIKVPFYFQGLMQGAAGAIIGLAILLTAYGYMASRIEPGSFSGLFTIRFLSPLALGMIVLFSMLVGWFGAYISLKQYLKA